MHPLTRGLDKNTMGIVAGRLTALIVRERLWDRGTEVRSIAFIAPFRFQILYLSNIKRSNLRLD